MSISDLDILLKNLEPILDAEEYVFCTVNDELQNYLEFKPLATFIEKEGLTLVLTKQQAQRLGACTNSIFKNITLSVYSSLNAVGLTAAISTALAQNGISANVIAAYHHDHIFVPSEKAHLALDILKAL